eukprot:scaffold339390_cov17-Prasinocladus_malaysianus.AAC.1
MMKTRGITSNCDGTILTSAFDRQPCLRMSTRPGMSSACKNRLRSQLMHAQPVSNELAKPKVSNIR